MKSCYFICKTHQLLSYKQSEKLCKKKLVGISNQEEGKFIEYMVVSYNILLDDAKNVKNLSEKLEKINIPFGKGKYYSFIVFFYFYFKYNRPKI